MTNNHNYAALYDHAASVFQCNIDSIHGPHHWRMVEENGLLIAESSGDNFADVHVVRLFAIYHDACRTGDDFNTVHGPKAADMIVNMDGQLQVNEEQLHLLQYAIRHHTDGETHDDPTIGTCWDADRLDLERVGIVPDPDLMSTAAGKRIAELGSKALYLEGI